MKLPTGPMSPETIAYLEQEIADQKRKDKEQWRWAVKQDIMILLRLTTRLGLVALPVVPIAWFVPTPFNYFVAGVYSVVAILIVNRMLNDT